MGVSHDGNPIPYGCIDKPLEVVSAFKYGENNSCSADISVFQGASSPSIPSIPSIPSAWFVWWKLDCSGKGVELPGPNMGDVRLLPGNWLCIALKS